MEMTLIYTIIGFGLAGYSVIGNDSIQTLGTFIASKEKRIESWQRKFGNELSIESALPNEGHKKIAEIMQNKDSFLITQNVDNLHQDSGVDEEKISDFLFKIFHHPVKFLFFMIL